MSIVSVFNGLYCRQEEVIQRLVERADFRLVRDEDVVVAAGRLYGLSPEQAALAMDDRRSDFNPFSLEREQALCRLRIALAEMLPVGPPLLVAGRLTHLIPPAISHMLRVCLIAGMKSRVALGRSRLGSREKAVHRIRETDDACRAWVERLTGNPDPWAGSLYDIVIPMDKVAVSDAVELILKHFDQDILRPTPESRRAMDDFRLAARIESILAEEGYRVRVAARAGVVLLMPRQALVMRSRLEEELRAIVEGQPGVRSVEVHAQAEQPVLHGVRIAAGERKPKVLLVDDEREFVQILSKRLQLRKMGPEVAFDGESALARIGDGKDDPEVMILDLRMPGIDGIEVLRRVKQNRPEIEVIILTGYGSPQDRETCLRLGAFAFFHKPVDIDELADALKSAQEKIRRRLRR